MSGILFWLYIFLLSVFQAVVISIALVYLIVITKFWMCYEISI